MTLVDEQRRRRRSAEARQAVRVTRLYGAAFKRLQPAIQAVTAQAGAVEGGMTGRQIVESDAFRALMQQTLDVFGTFGRDLYNLTVEGVRMGVADGLVDAQSLILAPVKAHDRERAAGMLTMPTPEDVLGNVGVRSDA